jgi:elongation factor P
MLDYNEIRERKYIILDGEPYEVLDVHIFRKQQRKPVNQTKLRNLITGSMRNQTFHANDNVEEAEIGKKTIKFIYKKDNRQTNNSEYWFCDVKNPANRFFLTEDIIGDQWKYMKNDSELEAKMFGERLIGVSVPIKVELKVTEAAPAVRGNTVTGAAKQVKVETGATINVPIFVNEGDTIRVNTDTGEYTERVSN